MLKRWVADRLPYVFQSAGRYWYRRCLGRLDPEMIALERLVRADDRRNIKKRALDIGANRGVYSYFFTRLGFEVEAFEPLPEFRDVIAAVPGGSVCVHNVALSSQSGRQRFFVPVYEGRLESQLARLGEFEAEGRALDVDVRTLDSFGFDNVAVIKIDVEGHELDVLRGGAETIAKYRPVLLIEIEERHAGKEKVEKTLEWLRDRGYSCLQSFTSNFLFVHGA